MKKVALDPGHFGGSLSKLENRHFTLDGFPPVVEGDLNLKVSKKLKDLLEGSGVEVLISRDSFEGGTVPTSEEFKEFQEQNYQERAKKINDFSPDLMLAIHLNSNCYSDNMFMTELNGVMTFIKDRTVLAEAKIISKHLADGFGLGFCEKDWFPEEVRDLWEDIGDGVNIRDLFILRNVKAKGILTEGPIMNNKTVYESLAKDDSLLNVYAESLHRGVLEVFK